MHKAKQAVANLKAWYYGLWKCGIIAYILKLKSYSMLLILYNEICVFSTQVFQKPTSYLFEILSNSIINSKFCMGVDLNISQIF